MFKYFSGEVNKAFLSIMIGRMILRVSVALLGLFLPIFLYNMFEKNVSYVIVYYIISHSLYALFVATGCKYIMNKIGFRRSIIISSVVGAIYYTTFYFISKIHETTAFEFSFSNPIFLLFIFNLFFIVLWRIVFWTPVHTDMAKFTDKKNRGRELGTFEALTYFINALGPIFAGWVIVNYNYDVLFIIAILLFLISVIPFSQMPHTHERFSWGVLQTWRKFFHKKRRRTVVAYMGNGAETVVDAVVWPIFIFELLKGNFLEVGAISSLIVVVTIFLQLLAGKYTDKLNKDRMLHWGSAFYAIGWIVKAFISTALQVFFVSTLHNFSRIFSRTPFETIMYERAVEQGHYIDEYAVIHEMAIQIGKVAVLVIILSALNFASLPVAFLFAALASLFMNFLVGGEKVKK